MGKKQSAKVMGGGWRLPANNDVRLTEFLSTEYCSAAEYYSVTEDHSVNDHPQEAKK
jgi:hypothetical protein